ncbi:MULTISPECIES: acetylserotonin O-methyltransferase [Actinosynnema]|uniref:acetylserotonin O-methyltransferase n=1 Tax=Actinosynnema TaxID=40566 RepID=UPI0020A4F39A|nr:acetylserotonin O-methyltransferase [Actinosynnema pretiosum]MCP2092296.1 dimerization domain-containing protein [Actinosynnema pretiosum]
MPCTIDAPLTAHDRELVAGAVEFARTATGAAALELVLGRPAPLELQAHLEFAHAAVLVRAESPEAVAPLLRGLGVEPRPPVPSTVVRDRLTRRAGRPVRVEIVHGAVGGGFPGRELELFVLTGDHPLTPADQDREAHLAFRAEGDAVVLRGVHTALLEAGLVPDGGGHNAHEGTSVLYFRGEHRLELALPGHHGALLRHHLGEEDGDSADRDSDGGGSGGADSDDGGAAGGDRAGEGDAAGGGEGAEDRAARNCVAGNREVGNRVARDREVGNRVARDHAAGDRAAVSDPTEAAALFDAAVFGAALDEGAFAGGALDAAVFGAGVFDRCAPGAAAPGVAALGTAALGGVDLDGAAVGAAAFHRTASGPRTTNPTGGPFPLSANESGTDTAPAPAHDASAPAPDAPAPDAARHHVLTLLTGAWRTSAVATAAELGVADHLADGPRTTEDLAARVGAQADPLHRLLRFLASLGVFAHEDGRWRLTPAADLLRTGAEGSQRDLARVYGGLFYRSFGALTHSVRTGGCAFTEVFGADPFDHFADHPDDARLFEGAMAAGTGFLAHVPPLLDVPAGGTVVDVGGGDGTLLRLVLESVPGARGVLFDREHVAGSARAALGERADVVPGDFFLDPLPSGGDCYLLSRILHDWDDERCAVLLANLRAAMPDGKPLCLVERPIREVPTPLALGFDLHMMVNNVHGREREVGEYRDLLAAAGFRLERVLDLPLEMALLIAR